MIYLRLFWEYFKVGLFSVGGGMATIPFLKDMADKTGWFTRSELADMLAVSESTPGAIGVNMATYVGYKTAAPQGALEGMLGALAATFGLVAPSVIVILLIARVLQQFRRSRFVEYGFYGLRPASTGLIAAAGLTVCAMALLRPELYAATGIPADLFRWKGCLLALTVLVLSNWVKPTRNWHPIVFIGISALAGIVFHFADV